MPILIAGIAIIFSANIVAYTLTAWLYYWKSGPKQLNNISIQSYFTEPRISLRPWTGFTEICIFTFFFLVQPGIIIGYLILRGIEGYRGSGKTEPEEKNNEHKNYAKDNTAERKGELNSIGTPPEYCKVGAASYKVQSIRMSFDDQPVANDRLGSVYMLVHPLPDPCGAVDPKESGLLF